MISFRKSLEILRNMKYHFETFLKISSKNKANQTKEKMFITIKNC